MKTNRMKLDYVTDMDDVKLFRKRNQPSNVITN